MRAFIALFVVFPIGLFMMRRQSMDNKKYPNTYAAHFERSNKLYQQSKKMEKRYGKDSDQAKAAHKEYADERAAYTEYEKKNREEEI